MTIQTRYLQEQDIAAITTAFAALGWNKPASQYETYLAEQAREQRVVIVAFVDSTFAGYVTVNWEPDYPPFRAESIPEIQDFNVLPQFRRQGIGSRLMDEAEAIIARRSPVAGIGVGMYADYGAAQRMYARRGYIPDGRGLFSHGRWVQPGETVVVDDDLSLHFTKTF